MGNKENKKITQVVEAAAKILKENPHLKYKDAIDQAKREYAEANNDRMV